MKKIYLLITSIGFIGLSCFAQSPKDIVSIPSPNAMSLGQFASQPVTLSAGLAQISVPIYTIKEKDFTLPITLNYNASGIRPDVHPGWVGMNWSLNAGGVITRVVHGAPDEMRWIKEVLVVNDNKTFNFDFRIGYGYYQPKLDRDDWSSVDYVRELAKAEKQVDTEPDEFIFNFSGYSGKFYFDEKGATRVISEPGIKVEFDVDLVDEETEQEIESPLFFQAGDGYVTWYGFYCKGFKITTPDGYQYEFGCYHQPISASRAVESSIDFFQENFVRRTWDSWYLTKIKNPFDEEVMSFTYAIGPPIATFGRTIAMDREQSSAKGSGIFKIFGPELTSSTSITERFHGRLILPTYLSMIESKNFRIKFNTSWARELQYDYEAIRNSLQEQASSIFTKEKHGLPARQQIAASVIDMESGESSSVYTIRRPDIKRADFTFNVQKYYDDISRGGRITGLKFVDRKTVLEGIDFRRLGWQKLDRIEIYDKNTDKINRSVNFTYNSSNAERLMLMSLREFGGNNKALPPYLFEYEDFNSNVYPGTYSLPRYNSYQTDHWGFYNGTDSGEELDLRLSFSQLEPLFVNYKNKRTTKAEYLYTGILNKITYPTGGTTEFTFEAHQYKQVVARLTDDGEMYVKTLDQPEFCGGLRIKKNS